MHDLIITENTKIKELEPYKGKREIALLRWNEPEPGFFIAESKTVIEIALEEGYEPVSAVVLKKMAEDPVLSKLEDIPIYLVDEDKAKEEFGYQIPSGICCLMKRKKEAYALSDILARSKRIVILEDIENPTNMGAIMRSCAGLGVDAVLLTKDCTDPLYRRALRVSVGTTLKVPWGYVDLVYDINQIKENGFKLAAMALDQKSISIEELQLMKDKKLALVLGNEGYGLKRKTISKCDYVVKIPMQSGVDSLNVAVAAGIAIWELLK